MIQYESSEQLEETLTPDRAAAMIRNVKTKIDKREYPSTTILKSRQAAK